MMPHSQLHKRVKLWTMCDWRFSPTKGKLQKKLNKEKSKPEDEQDKGFIEKLIARLKEMV